MKEELLLKMILIVRIVIRTNLFTFWKPRLRTVGQKKGAQLKAKPRPKMKRAAFAALAFAYL